MTVELRVLAGARRGTTVRSDKPMVTIGRHPSCDLQLDPESDLDVSARHAEIHAVAGGYLVRDAGSTNGTLVNGVAITGDRPLRHGDVIGLGPGGPTVQVQLVGVPSSRRGVLVAGMLLLVGVSAALVTLWRSRQATRAADAAPVLAGAATTTTGGTPRGGATSEASNDFRAAFAASGPAIAYVVTELDGQLYGGTAFGVRADGLLVTNRHLVIRGRSQATRVRVQFADTPSWREARIERLAPDPANDIALLRVDTTGTGPIPIVAGIDTVAPAVGAPVASIGFPLADGMPMDTVQHRSVARASLMSGYVSRSLERLLQIHSFAAHGSSGSPVVDRDGRVLGVVYGGPADTGGQIVWAVPGRMVHELVASRAGP